MDQEPVTKADLKTIAQRIDVRLDTHTQQLDGRLREHAEEFDETVGKLFRTVALQSDLDEVKQDVKDIKQGINTLLTSTC